MSDEKEKQPIHGPAAEELSDADLNEVAGGGATNKPPPPPPAPPMAPLTPSAT